MPLYNTITLSEDVTAHVRLLLPPDMVSRDSAEKYPMIVKVYGGPGTTRVKDNFELGKDKKYVVKRYFSSFKNCYY